MATNHAADSYRVLWCCCSRCCNVWRREYFALCERYTVFQITNCEFRFVLLDSLREMICWPAELWCTLIDISIEWSAAVAARLFFSLNYE